MNFSFSSLLCDWTQTDCDVLHSDAAEHTDAASSLMLFGLLNSISVQSVCYQRMAKKKRILLFYHLLWILIFENACSQMQEMYKYPFLAKELKQPVKVSCTLKPTHSLVLFIWHGGRRLFSSKGSTDVRWRFLKGCKLDDNWIHFAEAEITDVSK